MTRPNVVIVVNSSGEVPGQHDSTSNESVAETLGVGSELKGQVITRHLSEREARFA
jgi:hypothetical protein